MQFLGCYMGQKEIFGDASESILRLTGTELQAKQIERLCHFYGTLLESELLASILAGETSHSLEGHRDDLHYLMLDGAMFLTREDSWSEAKMARIFKAGDHFELSEKRGWIRESQYVVHLGGHGDFLEKLEYQIHCLGNIVILADGARWIWDWAEATYPEMVQILDYYHATEHLWAFAREYLKDESQRKVWVEAQTALLWDDGVAKLIQTLEQLPDLVTKSVEKMRNALVSYYRTNQKRMMYRTFREAGLLIGSGPIESANRNVLQKRLKLSGQRWSEFGWQAVANLRALEKSGRWNEMIALTQTIIAA